MPYCIITNVNWKGHNIVPSPKPSLNLAYNTSWTPEIHCLLPTQLTLSMLSTSKIGFKVKINGKFSYNDNGIDDTKILILFSVTEGKTWNELSTIETTNDGSYYMEWMPSATGNYLVKAIWRGNKTFPASEVKSSLAVIPHEEEYIFSVVSNSTISDLNFNSTNKVLSFTVEGQSDTRGSAKITISKDLITDIKNTEIYIDGKETKYDFMSVNNSWILNINYNHSTHNIMIYLPSAKGVKINQIIPILVLVVIGIIMTVILKKNILREQ